MYRKVPVVVSIFVICLTVSLPTSFAQYHPEDLFQFSQYWQQEPANETSYGFNFDPGLLIDKRDLLRFIERWRAPNEIAINLPGGVTPGVVTMEMVKIPAGSFMMGRYSGEQDSDSNEIPQHQVNIGYDFYIGKYEVTQAQWIALEGTIPWWGKDYVLYDPNGPAVSLSWGDCQSFISALNRLGQGTFRLPSEAEWEYACRAGTTTRYYWGDDPDYSEIDDYAWWYGNTLDANERYTHVVGQKLPNAFGLYDMSGNVREWCQDYWHSDYTGAPTDGSAWESPTAMNRLFRGGTWSNHAKYCRSAARFSYNPIYYYYNFGFRIVREVE